MTSLRLHRRTIYLTLAWFAVTCLAVPSPAQLYVTPITTTSVDKAIQQIKARPVNGVYTQCAKAGEFALTFDE